MPKNLLLASLFFRFFITHNTATSWLGKLMLLTAFLFSGVAVGQTTIINPTGDGGFENGNTFPLNGWTATTGTAAQNRWVCNTGATPGFGGVRAAYVTNNSAGVPPSHTYAANGVRVTHLFRPVTIPAGQTDIQLNFDFICNGETWNGNPLDYLRVWKVPNNANAGNFPTYGTAITANPNRILLGQGNLQTTWANANLTLPANFAGTTFRLVFEWTNDISVANNPPAGIDNISLISQVVVSPSNNDCAGAILLTPSTDATCNATAGTTVGATQSIPALACNGFTGNADDDVWYSFVATETNHNIIVTPGTLNDAVVELRTAACNGTNIACADVPGGASTETINASGLIVGTAYNVRVYSYGANGNQGTFNICVTTPDIVYCEPVSEGPQYVYIDDVRFMGTLNDVDNINSGYNNGYQDWTGLPNAEQAQGEGINIFYNNYSYAGLAYVKAWIDWNQDGDFNDGGELIYDTEFTATASASFGFIIPPSTPPGNYRLRIRNNINYDYYGSGGTFWYDFNSCEDFSYTSWEDYDGEAEDYLFTVIENCAANIATVIDNERCGTGTVDLSVTGTAGSTSFNWYASEIGGMPLSNNAGTYTTPSISDTTTYYVTASNGICESLVRIPVVATVNPVTDVTFDPPTLVACGENAISVSASGDTEIFYLIDEDFEDGDLGVFTNQNNSVNGATYDDITMWQNIMSTYIPNNTSVWSPAISSGFGTNHFAMSTSDVNPPGNVYQHLLSTIVDAGGVTDLVLTFDMYYSNFNDYVDVQVNDGSDWTTVKTYNTSVGIGTRFESQTIDLSAYDDTDSLRIRIRFRSGWGDGIAVDNIKLYGIQPVVPAFTWTSTPAVDAYIDPGFITPYVEGMPASIVYIRPTLAQLELNTFDISATITLSNGCSISESTTITNNTKVWRGDQNTSQNWDNPSNWKPNGIPTEDNCVIIPSITKIANGPPLPSFEYIAYAKNITIKSTGNLEILSGNNLTVTDWIHNEGTNNFDIRNDASLIQINSVPNIGSLKVDRTASVSKTDYIYYSSPVDNNNLATVSPNTSNSAKFKWIPTLLNGAFQYGNWASPGSELMGLGRGYIVKGPNNFITPMILTVTFDGTPRNGDIQVPITRGTYDGPDTDDNGRLVTKDDDNYNLIGNPYPSAIFAKTFIEDPLNSNISGSIYLWPHGGIYSAANPSPFYQDFGYNYNSEDYITYNGIGSVPPNTFDGYIAAGQAFFVLMTDDASITEDLYFNNEMRVTNNNSQFLRASNEATDANDSAEANRIYLDLILPTGKTSSTLIGYTQNATYELDRLYDSPILDNSSQNLYSVIGTEKLIIQGRPMPLDVMDEVPLGILIPQQGIYTIAINSIDGLFANTDQNIFLEDLVTGIVHNLKNAPYMFTVEIGRYDNRFILRYNDDNTLNTPEVVTNSDLDIIGLKAYIKVISGSSPIKTINVYDAVGRRLTEYNNVNEMEFKIPLDQLSVGTLIVKVTLENGKQKNKKVIH